MSNSSFAYTYVRNALPQKPAPKPQPAPPAATTNKNDAPPKGH
ncbi:MAG TPA: hypothetical protein VGM83_17435 [Devosiaceae bacterium]|jgi:hypothetical protein